MNKKLVALLIYALIVVFYFILDLKLTYFQIVAFPFFLLALWIGFEKYLPKTIIYVSFLLCAVGVLKNFEFLNINTNSFYIARFEEDNFEAKTTLLRKKVNAYLKGDNVAVKRYYGSFSNFSQVDQFFKKNNLVKGVIWAGKRNGETQDLYLSMRVVRPNRVSDFVEPKIISTKYSKVGLNKKNLEKFSKIVSEIRIFENVPIVHMPEGLHKGGSAYLAELIQGITLNSELNLAYASKILSKWNISDHLVFARFMLGNYYLKNFFTNGFSEVSELECALNYYNSAKRLSNLLPNKKLFYGTLEYNRLVAKMLYNFHHKNLKNIKELKLKIKLLAKLLSDINLEDKELEIQAKRLVLQSKNLIGVISKLKKQIINKNDRL